jgi:Restriction endonuclease
MANIKAIDMRFLDDLFEMHGGYVLDFTNRTMAEFFANELDIDIDEPAYTKAGSSKGKRLRCFLQTADMRTVVRALRALCEYRDAVRPGLSDHDKARLTKFIARLEGNQPQETQARAAQPKPVTDDARIVQLGHDLIALTRLEPQPRGYAFEKFLKGLFDAHGLEARDAFRIVGEQIDGSFQLADETYLLEAKWKGAPSGLNDLRAFNGKVEAKAAWARGLFVSQTGFTEDGLHAFGGGRRVICMDGLDLHDTLSRGLSLSAVLKRKVRRAAETGASFARVRDLFPV